MSFALAVTSLGKLGPTFDEQGFLVRGLAYLRGASRDIRVGHPLGLNALNTLLLVGDESVRLPTDDPDWGGTDFHRPAELFLWEIGNDVNHIMFVARVATIWLALLLAALAGRWAWALTRRQGAGLLALALVAFDPNLAAHGRLTTTDLGLAAFSLLAAYTLWRFWQRPDWRRAVVAGIAFGLLQNTKFTAGLYVPLFALLILLCWLRDRRRRTLLVVIGAYAVVAPLALWAAYGFQVGTLPDTLPALPQLGGLTLPLSHHLEQLLDIGGRLQVATPSFLLGSYSDSGWWTYFPVAFALKTPLPTLLLVGVALLLRGRHYLSNAIGRWRTLPDDAALLLPALGYFAIALTSDINLGYRHLLPVLPPLYIFAATVVLPAGGGTSRTRAALSGLAAGWLVIVALWIHPHPLAYFNAAAGGPDNGWRALVDSNLDWGQDLGNLATWLSENEVERIWLSYFGEARPEYYGIRYTGLDSWPPRLMNPDARPFYPADPAPGLYAISATTLQGVHFQDHDRFAWFREKEPVAKIGYSIFLYEVAPTGQPVQLALGGVQLDALSETDFALLGSNAVTPHWFDPAQSLLLPAGADGWLAINPDARRLPTLGTLLEDRAPVAENAGYTLYRLRPDIPTGVPLATYEQDGDSAALLGHDLPTSPRVSAGERLTFTTVWRKAAPPLPLRIFVHLTDADGVIAAQWDGLGAAWEGWRAGDVLRQAHWLDLPADLPPGAYELRLGLYNPQTDVRWQPGVDRSWYDLPTVTVSQLEQE